RPEHLHLAEASPHHLPVQVELVEALGNETYLSIAFSQPVDVSNLVAPPTRLQVRINPEHRVREGESLWLSVQVDKVHLFEPETGAALIT
ncbi:MAG TPA: TOBE domain-containing protein, partial [Candidatus Caenarcaniphilales bacterium]